MLPTRQSFTATFSTCLLAVFTFSIAVLLTAYTLTYLHSSNVFTTAVHYSFRDGCHTEIDRKAVFSQNRTTLPNEINVHQEKLKIHGADVFYPNISLRRLGERCPLVRGRRIVLTYGSHGRYAEQARNCCLIAMHKPQIDMCIQAGPSFLDEVFEKQNEHIFKQGRGSGYWIWKPYTLFRFLTEILNEDDVLFYLDADKKLLTNLEEYICLQAEVKQDVVIFYQPYVEREWTKADAFVLMNVEKIQNISDTMQIYASFLLLRKSTYSVRFVAEWLTYAQDERIVTDMPSQIRNETSDFKENRHDQSVLSLLTKRWNIASWPDPIGDWNAPQRSFDSHGHQFTSFNRFSPGNFSTPIQPLIGHNLFGVD